MRWPIVALAVAMLWFATPAQVAGKGHHLFVWTADQASFSFANRGWPHGWNGGATPHGAVFSR